MKQFLVLFSRDIKLNIRSGGGALLSCFFFFILIAILPFAVGPDLQLLSKIGSAIIWFAALLSLLLGLDHLFKADYDDGSLDVMLSSNISTELIVITKLIAYWCVNALPLIFITPLLGLMLNINFFEITILCLSLLIGTPALAALGAIGASLTLRMVKGGVLLPVLILPFTVPILIFGVSATANIANGQAYIMQSLIYLSGISLLCCAGAPLTAAYALKRIQ